MISFFFFFGGGRGGRTERKDGRPPSFTGDLGRDAAFPTLPQPRACRPVMRTLHRLFLLSLEKQRETRHLNCTRSHDVAAAFEGRALGYSDVRER